MTSLYLASNAPSSGKTVITLGLALKLKEKGYTVGYLKPSGRLPESKDNELYDDDSVFINDVLDLKEPLEIVSPFVFNTRTWHALLGGSPVDARKRILTAYQTLMHKDFILLGGGIDIFDGTTSDIGILDLLDEMNAKVLIVDQWRGMVTMDTLLGTARLLGARGLGGMINKVPESLLQYVKEPIKTFLETKGVKVFGIFPKDKLLESITVGNLLEVLNGEILCCERGLEEFVENFLIGAMDADSAIKHFNRVPNKAVITGAHRTDIQLAALETSTKCIILTGGLRTSDMILGQAISRGIPVISVTEDTFTTVDKIESALKRISIREKGKVLRAKELVDREFDLDGLLASIV
jgi:BioD-like phosphotransacetylase family protein